MKKASRASSKQLLYNVPEINNFKIQRSISPNLRDLPYEEIIDNVYNR
jgi:hypothetical protein